MPKTLEDNVREQVIAGEEEAFGRGVLAKNKEALRPLYELFLKELSRSDRPLLERVDEYLRVNRAMRDTEAAAGLESRASRAPGDLLAEAGPLPVLAAYLERLDATLLIIENGASALTLCSVRSGAEPLHERVALARGSKELVAAVTAFMLAHRRLLAAAFEDGPAAWDSSPLELAAKAVWDSLPPTLAAALRQSKTLFYMPGSFGDLNEFSIELLFCDGAWLGVSRSIARVSSFRTLLEVLSPNRMPSALSPRASIVRAQDTEDLTSAEKELAAVQSALTDLELGTTVEKQPRAKRIKKRLDAGERLLHYIGHGFQGPLAEVLQLAPDELLGPHDFSQLAGSQTPFVYLSTCQVGKARIGTSGNAVGIAARLVEKGAPAVVGCLQRVPDVVAREMAKAFYASCRDQVAGMALAQARARNSKYPVATWGVFALFGDPNVDLAARNATQSRHLTRRWDSHVGRHLATRSPKARDAALAALAAASGDWKKQRKDVDAIAGWLRDSFQPSDEGAYGRRLALCRKLVGMDVIAATELRMLLAMETLEGVYLGTDRVDFMVAPDEALMGLQCATQIGDTIAWSAFALKSVEQGVVDTTESLFVLEEASGRLEGWRIEEPEVADLLARVSAAKRDLHPTQ